MQLTILNTELEFNKGIKDNDIIIEGLNKGDNIVQSLLPQCDLSSDQTGWIVIHNNGYVILPVLYNMLSMYIGKDTLEDIINIDLTPTSKNPFAGIGILGLMNDIEDILDYYLQLPIDNNNYRRYKALSCDLDKIFIKYIQVKNIDFTLNVKYSKLNELITEFNNTANIRLLQDIQLVYNIILELIIEKLMDSNNRPILGGRICLINY